MCNKVVYVPHTRQEYEQNNDYSDVALIGAADIVSQTCIVMDSGSNVASHTPPPKPKLSTMRSTTKASPADLTQRPPSTTNGEVCSRRRRSAVSPSYLKKWDRAFSDLPEDDVDRKHLIACPLARCSRCIWALCKKEWGTKCRVDVAHPELGTWLLGVESGGTWGVRCTICHAAKMPGAFSNGLVIDNLRISLLYNHAKSRAHIKACAIQKGADAKTWDCEGAPAEGLFKTLLDAVRQGKASGEKGVNGVGKRWKCRKMKFCLAEAKRQLVRKALREAIVIAVHQDGRKGRLAIRFNTCNNKLETYQGVLGSANLAKDFSMDAIGMRDATLAIIQNICTPKLWLPFRRPGRKVEASTFINVFDKLELFDADAAEDETVAGKLLRGTRQGNDNGQVFDTMFPNLKICNRDKPHGSRRNFGNV